MSQSDLFLKPIDSKFTDFHSKNPAVYELFKRFAVEALVAGKTKIGAKAIAERIRWSVEIEARGGEFKLNNSYVSRYARLLAKEDPRIGSLFNFRGLKS